MSVISKNNLFSMETKEIFKERKPNKTPEWFNFNKCFTIQEFIVQRFE